MGVVHRSVLSMMIKSMGRTLLQVSLPTTLCANTIVVDIRMHICDDVCLSIFSSTLMCVYLCLPVLVVMYVQG